MLKTIFGKKQILLAGLVIALGAAVYLNYHFSTKNPIAKETGGNKTDVTTTAKKDTAATDGDKNLGESIYVSGKNDGETEDANNYFVKARAEREASREKALDIIKDVSSDVTISEETLKDILNQASNIAKAVEQESKIESLIKAKKFAECIVYIEKDKCSVVVKADDLTPTQILQITDIITAQSSVVNANVNIVSVK